MIETYSPSRTKYYCVLTKLLNVWYELYVYSGNQVPLGWIRKLIVDRLDSKYSIKPEDKFWTKILLNDISNFLILFSWLYLLTLCLKHSEWEAIFFRSALLECRGFFFDDGRRLCWNQWNNSCISLFIISNGLDSFAYTPIRLGCDYKRVFWRHHSPDRFKNAVIVFMFFSCMLSYVWIEFSSRK